MSMNLGSNQGPISEINVTPMVDVMLVLLIIFMVTAPMMQQGVKVELPNAKSASMPAPQDDSALVLTITVDKRAYLGTSEIPFDRIEDLLGNNAKLQQDKEIYLHADHRLDYGTVVAVMAAAKAGGAETLGMVTDPTATAPKLSK
ncbi:MAG: protein TolR [Deltaproteobacteria bacterium]|nr:protein TolR [Deltaproteobacteria bacterium]